MRREHDLSPSGQHEPACHEKSEKGRGGPINRITDVIGETVSLRQAARKLEGYECVLRRVLGGHDPNQPYQQARGDDSPGLHQGFILKELEGWLGCAHEIPAFC